MRTHGFHVRPRLIHLLPLLVAAACASHSAPPPDDDGGRAHGRLMAVKCGRGNGQGNALRIGAGGGRVRVDRHSLTVPEGAVAAPTTFTIMEVASQSIRVELGPDGTQFEQPATLTLSFDRCGGHPRDFTHLQILQVDGNDSVIAALPSIVDHRRGTVTATLHHLSGYLVGGNLSEGS